jgi:hypothetical protein
VFSRNEYLSQTPKGIRLAIEDNQTCGIFLLDMETGLYQKLVTVGTDWNLILRLLRIPGVFATRSKLVGWEAAPIRGDPIHLTSWYTLFIINPFF